MVTAQREHLTGLSSAIGGDIVRVPGLGW